MAKTRKKISIERLPQLQLFASNRPVSVIKYWRDNAILELSPVYQRGDVWGTKRRVNFIKSMLMRIPIPSIIVNDRAAGEWVFEAWKYAIIDGKQRCTTLLMFLDSELPIPGNWIGLTQKSVVYADMPERIQRNISLMPIGMSEGSLRTLEEERQVFELVNFGGLAQGEKDE